MHRYNLLFDIHKYKKIINFLIVYFNFLIVNLVTGTVNISGDVSGIWTKADSLYIITDNIRIPNGDTLIIEPGVRVEFQKSTYGYNLNICGRLIATGTTSEYIIFTSNEATPAKGDWCGIRILPYADNITLNYCIISYAQTAIESDTSNQLNFSNIRIDSCSSAGIFVKDCLSDIEIMECTIQECTSYGILVEASNEQHISISSNLIKDIQRSSTDEIIKAISIHGPVQIEINNNIITNLNNDIGSGYREAYCYGIEINQSKQTEIRNNSLSNLIAIGSTGTTTPRNAHCYGISVTSEYEVIIESNKIDSLTSGGGGTELRSITDAIYIGFHGNNIKIMNNEIHELKGKYDPIGISLSGSSTIGGEIEIKENTIYNIESSNPWHQNRYGIGIYLDFWQSTHFSLMINDNIIHSNEGKGIEFKIYDIQDIQVFEMIGNSIHDCANTGIIFNPNSLQFTPQIMFNRIWNTDVGISLGKCNPELHYNDFINNSSYDIRNESSENLDAQFNYWGPVTTAEIESGDNPKNISKIFDQFDDNTKGTVDYDNWLTGEPVVLQVDPNNLKNEGVSQVIIRGRGFVDGATVKLRKEGLQDIIGTVTSSDSFKIKVNFDCTGRQQGNWDVVVINPGSHNLVLFDEVWIGEGYINLWVDIIGRNQFRVGREASLIINVGNRGNINVDSLVLLLSLPAGIEYLLELPLPSGTPGIDWSSFPYAVTNNSNTLIPILIKQLHGGQSCYITLKFTVGTTSLERSLFSHIVQQNDDTINATLLDESQSKQFLQSTEDSYIEELNSILPTYGINGISKAELRQKLNERMNNWKWEPVIGYGLVLLLAGIAASVLILAYGVPVSIAIGASIAVASLGAFIVSVFSLSDDFEHTAPARSTHPFQRVFSLDPNEKAGPSGYGVNHSIPSDDLLQYIVYFENVDSATAAAEEVLLQDTLYIDLDWSTFELGEIVFGETTLIPPAQSQDYSTTVVLNDTTHVEVTCTFESGTGKAEWYLKGIDPRDGYFMGFLPPNVNPPEGEGHVSFTIKPKTKLASGTQIRNRASITFDVNPPMKTNEIINTIDALPPSSSITGYQNVKIPQVNIQWNGQDEPSGSGVKNYSVFIATDGGPYTAWLRDTLATLGIFSAEEFQRYDLYSEARDSVGHKEPMPMEPDTSIQPMAFYEFPQQAWYMVSLPVQTEIDSVKKLFPSSLGAFRWSNGSRLYPATEVMSTTTGYWLALPESDSLIISGVLVDTIKYHYQPGWHLIGSLSRSINVANPNDNPDGAVLIFYGWDAQAGQYFQTTTLHPKQAFWMAVMVECDLTLGGDVPLGKIAKARSNKIEFYEIFGSEPPAPPNYFFGDGMLGVMSEIYRLHQNYPNPFNFVTIIDFDLPKNSDVDIMIYNVLGQRVKTLADKKYSAGSYKILWDGRDEYNHPVASGIYLCRIKAGEFRAVKKLVLVR
jgi:hypothetical protein